MMSRPFLALAVLAPLCTFAKPWQGIDPGVARKADVIAKFGEPAKTLDARGKTVLLYQEKSAIKGTVQVQFKFDPKSEVIERIDVYPEPIISAEAIEKAYGSNCEDEAPTPVCYQKKEADGGKLYYLYGRLGLAVFFKDDNNTVQSMAFLPGKK